MPDRISCPHCRRLLEAPEDYRGREVRCPECQQVFVGGVQTDITTHAPQPIALPAASEVQPGLPASAGAAPWPKGRVGQETEDDDDYTHDLVPPRREFRPGGGLAHAVKVLLAFDLVLSFVSLGSNYLQYDIALRLIAGVNVPPAEIDSNDARQLALGIIVFLTFIATAIVFAIWFHRAHANLESLGARDLTYTSGWAAGCWFVPILNLWRPLQIAQEIWRNSDPSAVYGRRVRIEKPANSTLVGSWWAMWIISNVISNISARLSFAVNSPETLKIATAVALIAEVASILAAVLALAVVSGIDARQTARAKALLVTAESRWETDE